MTSERIPAGLAEIREWSFDDLMTAHDVLDAYEEAEREIARRAEAERQTRR